MRFFLNILAFFLIPTQAWCVGVIIGKLTDEKTGEAIIGASVVLQGTTNGTATDIDGSFRLTAEPGSYTIECKYIGYQAKEVSDIVVLDGQETNLNVTMIEAAATALGEVTVRSTLATENISAMITVQRNTNTVAQVVSAEAIRRSPDRNTGDVLKRVTAASIQDGRYLIIRGLADRYNQTTLNGALLSSTEPDRKTFSFDILPSSIIDHIVINKGATADLPGEFGGGLVQVHTRDIPTANFLTLVAGTGFNGQTIGQDFYGYKGGNLDFLGLDDGARDLPGGFPDRSFFQTSSAEQRYPVARTFRNDWDYQKKGAPLNTSFQLSGGLNTRLLRRNFGAVVALTYNKQNRRSELTRAFFNQAGDVQKILDFQDNTYSEEVLWGALANFSLALNDNHRISLKNLFNVTGYDALLLRTGRNNDFGADVRAFQMAFRSTQYYTSQLIGNHYLPKARLKIDWIGSYVRLHQDQPNLRRLEYRKSDNDSVYRANVPTILPTLASGSKFYSWLTDNIGGGNLDFTHTRSLFGANQTVKAGYMIQVRNRDFRSRPLGFVGGSAEQLTLPANELFSPEHMGPGGFTINELALRDYDYGANSALNAAYIMFDNNVGGQVRIVWGVRYELFHQALQGYQNNRPINVNTTVGDVLPSLSLTWRMPGNRNLRFGASQTVVRPEFRELSPFAFYDFELLAGVQGNPALRRTKITNLDLRYEIYPRAGELVTLGVFYKHFTNSIEQSFNESGVNSFTLSYINAPRANGFGVEGEFRKRLDGIAAPLQSFTAFANASYIYNQIQFSETSNGENALNRPMQGQSPYVINAGLQWDGDRSHTNATILFNIVGRRIFLVGNQQNPNIWEAPRPILDFQITQRVVRNLMDIKLSASDILNRHANFYQDKNDNGRYDQDADFLRISRRTGTNYTLSLIFNFR